MQNDASRQWAFLAPVVSGADLSAQAGSVEALGMAGIFVPEIYSSPFMGLGFCAAVTERVQLATGITNAFASSPFEIAMTAIDLDRVSGGRVVLGLGTSVKSWTEGFYGMPYGKPVQHMREVIEVIRMVVAKSHTGELAALRRRRSPARLVRISGSVRAAAAHRDPDLAGRQPAGAHPARRRDLRRVHRPPGPRAPVGSDPGPRRPRRWPEARRPRAHGHPLELLAVGRRQR